MTDTMAEQDEAFIAQAAALEERAAAYAKEAARAARSASAAEVIMGGLTPTAVATSTGLIALGGRTTAAAVVGLVATVLAAGYAGLAPSRHAGNQWAANAQFEALAGKVGDLWRIHAKYLPLRDAAECLTQYRDELRRIHERPGSMAAQGSRFP